MLQAFIITSREGLESFLIIAVILAYLRKTGRKNIIPAIYAGIGAAVLASLALGALLLKVANHSLWEGVLGLVATFLVGSLVIHMWRVGPSMKHQMEKKMGEISSQRASRAVTF